MEDSISTKGVYASITSMHQQTAYMFQTEEGSYLNIECEDNDIIILTLCMLGFFLYFFLSADFFQDQLL